MYASVVIEYPIKTLDKTFTYKIPEELNDKIKVGMKVSVPFNNHFVVGFVLNIVDDYEGNYELKEIKEILNPELVLSPELLSIADYLVKEVLCTKIVAIETMLPATLKTKAKKDDYALYETYVYLNKDIFIDEEKFKNKKKQLAIINILKNKEMVLKKEFAGSSLKALLSADIVREKKIQKYRLQERHKQEEIKTLTKDQDEAYQKIKSYFGQAKTILLWGVTGSGKTEVYINLIREVLKLGKTALVMVPEISLTTQIALRFYEVFGQDVAILHSSLSAGEKYDEYLKILRGEVLVVVGTRSAVFAPLQNLGIIIIDEEDSSSYKQENYPKYHARDVAIYRSIYNQIPLVLGSATPSLETKARADKKVYEEVVLTKRINGAQLPKIYIVDMAEEMRQKNMIFSSLLKQKIKEKLAKKEQIILLLNRRGYSTFITCSNCGYTYKCPSCDISLTYHKSTNNLICHYCGFQIPKNALCPKCGVDGLNYYGLGTEKLEAELKKLFPMARVIRMDQDVTSRKGRHEEIIKAFKKEEYDILLGTQMVSKGLDFPRVSLVGVINADTTLNIPDYKSNENTFALLHQVAGRAGRSTILGEVVIQTFNPDNYVIKWVAASNYQKFYLQEMTFRHKLKYPPYYYLVSIKVISKDYQIALNEAIKVKKYLIKNLLAKTIVLGPTTAAILKFKDEYRMQIIIKYQFDEKLKKVLKALDELYSTNKNCYIDIDFNPNRI